VRLEDVAQYQSIVDAEWSIIYGKLDAIVKSGASIVLSKLAIGDLATQYFADRKIFCAGRVGEDDLRRVCKATGAVIQTTVSNLVPAVLGTCGRFEEQQIGKERYNLFSGCPQARSSTIVLRGGGEQFIDEAERSLHDAIMVVRRSIRHSSVVAGGGAIEMELSRFLHDHALTIRGKEQLVISAFARALEVIPRQLADNAGFDSTVILNQLRQKHSQPGGTWFGVDIMNEGIVDAMASRVWEPALVKLNALTAATEAACTILSIDETIKSNPSAAPNAAAMQPATRPRH
jgi:T-complex protein 1 subunit eta